MIHPQIVGVGFLAVLTLLFSVDTFASGKWTHGRSSCDPTMKPLLGQVALEPGIHRPLAQAWEYSFQDIDFLRSLGCFPAAEKAAVELSARLHQLEGEIMPGIRAAACSEAGAEGAGMAIRSTLLRETLRKLQNAEAIFEESLDRTDRFRNAIAAEIPPGTPFDDCRNKASRGWATAKASLNKLSCEVMKSVQLLEAVEERNLALSCPATEASQVRMMYAAPLSEPSAETKP